MQSSPRIVSIAVASTLLVSLAACGSTVQLGAQSAQQAGTSSGLDSLTGGVSTAAPGATTPDPSQPGLSSSGGTTTTGQTSGAVPTDMPTTPVTGSLPPAGTSITAPIQIGVLDSEGLGAAGAAIGSKNPENYSGAQGARALINYFNAHGGIAGRKILLTEFTAKVSDSSYEQKAAAACASFTQDHHDVAVLSFLENAYYSSYEQCLSKAHVLSLNDLNGGTDTHDFASFPGLISVTGPTVNDRFSALIDHFVASGYLSPKNKIGVIVEDCAQNTRAFNETINPLMKQKGLANLTVRHVSCVGGFGDAAGAISAIGNTVLPFRTAGVDRVFFVSGLEPAFVQFFEKQAKSQHYEPSYALTSATGGFENSSNFNGSQMLRMQGVGWNPVRDIDAKTLPSSSSKRCFDALAGQGVKPKGKPDFELLQQCDLFFLLESILKATHGVSDLATLLTGLRSLGTSYVSPALLNGKTDYGARRQGPNAYQIFAYKTSCSCYVYTSSPGPK